MLSTFFNRSHIGIHLKNQQRFCKISLLNTEPLKTIVDPKDSLHPIVFHTPRYGVLKRMFSGHHSLATLDKVFYIDNRCSINFLFKCLKSDKKGLILFEPENSNNINILRIHAGVKKKLLNQYFGSKRNRKDAFRNCKGMAEIFHLNRRIQLEYKAALSRINVIVNYNGEVRTKDLATTSTKDSSQLAELIPPFYQHGDMLVKHDFLLSVGDWNGIFKAGKSKREGVEVQALNNTRIYPFYGVWPPTQHDLYILLRTHLEESKRVFKGAEKCLDIGCGTGVLSLVMATIEDVKEFYALDVSESAIECAKMNWMMIHPSKEFNAKVIDLVNKPKEEIIKFLNEKRFPAEFDLMVANPPWISTTPLRGDRELEMGNYDFEFSFLDRILWIASKYLSRVANKGRLLLIHSDISFHLGLSPETFLEAPLELYKLKAKRVKDIPFLSAHEMKSTNPDPLFPAKKDSKIILFEITRV